LKNNTMKERKKVAGDFSIFICAAEKRGHIPDGIRHITNSTTPAAWYKT